MPATAILTAYHEAGHAAVAIALGTPISCADLSGVVTLVRRGCPRAQRAEALIALSGPAAEIRHCGYDLAQQAALWGDPDAWATDLSNALRRLRPADSLALALQEARGLVHRSWDLVEVLAAVLLDRKELDANEITAVLGRGP